MGQRSQIYVRYNGKLIIANYYQWNYGERMISRARYGIEYILEYGKYAFYQIEKLRRIFDVNFDMKDIVISSDIFKEYEEWVVDYPKTPFLDFCFLTQHNNDGKLLVDIQGGAIKYAFLDYDCNVDRIMDAEQYMEWDIGEDWKIAFDGKSGSMSQDEIDTAKANIEWLNQNVMLMTKDEVSRFISDDISPTI